MFKPLQQFYPQSHPTFKKKYHKWNNMLILSFLVWLHSVIRECVICSCINSSLFTMWLIWCMACNSGSGVNVPCLKQSVPALMTEPDALSNGRNFRIKLQGWQHKSKRLPLVIPFKSVTLEKVLFSQDLHALTDNKCLRASFLMCRCVYWTDDKLNDWADDLRLG